MNRGRWHRFAGLEKGFADGNVGATNPNAIRDVGPKLALRTCESSKFSSVH